MKNTPRIIVREAVPEDIAQIMSFIRELAGYERVPEEVVTDEKKLKKVLFTDHKAETLIAEYEGKSAGFALFFQTFSSWLGKGGIYLDDLYVRPEYRSKGIGGALFQHIAKIAVERKCGRLEWSCPEWSAPSIAFYRAMGAEPLNGWTTFRLEGTQIRQASSRKKG